MQLQRLDQNTEQWHAARQCRLTASDVPAAISTNGSYGQPEDVVACKFRAAPATAAMLHGLRSEPAAAEAYRQALRSRLPAGSTVELQCVGFFAHAEHPWLGASPDRRVIIGVPGQPVEVAYVQLKCPFSRPLSDFAQLPEHIKVQVITELAVVNSHAEHAAAAVEVFIWKQGEPPVVHQIVWAAVQGRWQRNLLPKADAFFFNILGPELLRQQSSATRGGATAPTAAGQCGEQQVAAAAGSAAATSVFTPTKASLQAACRAATAAAMAAIADAAAQNAAAADTRSPIQLISPCLRVGKRVMHTRDNRVGSVTQIDAKQVYVDWDAVAVSQVGAAAGQQGSKPQPVKRKTAVDASYVVPLPIDMGSCDYMQPGAGDVRKQVVIVSGAHAGKLGTAVRQTGQKWTVRLATGEQRSVLAAALRLKAARSGSSGASSSASSGASSGGQVVILLLGA